MKRNHAETVLTSVPYLIWMVVFTVIPLLLVTYFAFTDETGAFTMANLSAVREYVAVIFRSIWLAFIATMLCLLIAYPLSYIISRAPQRRQRTYLLLVMLPMWINFLLRTYAMMSLMEDTGIINTLLQHIGISPLPLIRTNGAVILGMVYNFIPFMILQIHTSLAKMDKSLLEAANDLGATPVQAFLRVTLPLSLPGVISGITLVFLPAVSSFFIPKLLGGGQFVLVGNIIESQFLTSGDWNFGSAISLIMAIIIMLSMWLTRKVDVQPASRGKE